MSEAATEGAAVRVKIYTDGACSGNPGPGGCGAILIDGDTQREISGGEAHTTDNRMELLAALEALEALERPCGVDVFTDSQDLRQGVTAWIPGWPARGWRTADKKPVKNENPWRHIDAARTRQGGRLAQGRRSRRHPPEQPRRRPRGDRDDAVQAKELRLFKALYQPMPSGLKQALASSGHEPLRSSGKMLRPAKVRG